MRNLKMFTAVAAIALTMGVVGVSAATASTSFSGTISGSTWVGTVGPCDFTIGVSGGPPPATTLLTGSTFVGRGTTQPCDPTTLQILTNIDITYANADSGTIPAGLKVKDLSTGCTFTTTGAITITNNTSAGANGVWSGSGNATSPTFPCVLAPATINVSGTFS